MSRSDAAEQSLRNGDPAEALVRLQEDVRANPADAKLRVFLFQLLCVVGQWERALNQLTVEGGDPNGGADVTERVSFSFNKISVQYTPQAPDGSAQGATSFDDEWSVS